MTDQNESLKTDPEVEENSNSKTSEFVLPKWSRGQFLRKPDIYNGPDSFFLELGKIMEEDMAVQNDERRFLEFDDPLQSSQFGFTSDQIRERTCALSSVYTVCNSLNSEGIDEVANTVGKFAQNLLKNHTNDRVENGQTVAIGTPVFKEGVGWYHDALLWGAKEFAGLGGYRFENTDLDSLAEQTFIARQLAKDILVLISLKSEIWFGRDSTPEMGHILIVNGLDYKKGKLERIRISDVYREEGKEVTLNKWVDVDEKLREAYNQKAMIFLKE